MVEVAEPYAAVALDGLRRQRCKACWNADGFDFHVPNLIWEAVVPEALRNRVVCLACFDRFALERGVDYAPHVEAVRFAGSKASLLLRVATAASGS